MLAMLCMHASVSSNPPPNSATDGALLISANLSLLKVSHMSPTVSVVHNICEKSRVVRLWNRESIDALM